MAAGVGNDLQRTHLESSGFSGVYLRQSCPTFKVCRLFVRAEKYHRLPSARSQCLSEKCFSNSLCFTQRTQRGFRRYFYILVGVCLTRDFITQCFIFYYIIILYINNIIFVSRTAQIHFQTYTLQNGATLTHWRRIVE